MSLPSACPDDGEASIALAPTTSPGLPAPALTASGAPVTFPEVLPEALQEVIPEDLPPAPLVDPAALQDLGAQLDNPAVAKGFARDYTRMWDQRYRTLASAPATQARIKKLATPKARSLARSFPSLTITPSWLQLC